MTQGGYAGVRREAREAMVDIVGGPSRDRYEAVLREIGTDGEQAVWVAGSLTAEDLAAWDGRGTDKALVAAARM